MAGRICRPWQNFKALDGQIAAGIHQIGSTSVPRLAAKDFIDIQVTVRHIGIYTITPLLAQAGFVHLPHITCAPRPKGRDLDSAQLEKMIFNGAYRLVNLHVRIQGRFKQKYPILFRDYLCASAIAAHAYGEIKLQLARYFPTNIKAYYAIKAPVCDAIMAGAYVWAEATGWVAAVTDV